MCRSSPEGIARILSELPITSGQVREVYDAVTASSSNGYDEEYPFSNLFSCPGSGVGDELLKTRSAVEYSAPLAGLLASASPQTRSGSFSGCPFSLRTTDLLAIFGGLGRRVDACDHIQS